MKKSNRLLVSNQTGGTYAIPWAIKRLWITWFNNTAATLVGLVICQLYLCWGI